MYKLGLKLWSVNTDYYYDEAIRLYNEKVFDYIELYVVPNTLDKLEKWKKLKSPYLIHCPHFAHGFNLAKQDKLESNLKIFKEVQKYADDLNSEYIVVHGGIDGCIEETAKQFKKLNDTRTLIENKPMIALPNKMNGKFCRGFSPEEINQVIKTASCGFCLDFGHAICSAASQKTNPYSYIEKFINIKPKMFHLTDNTDMSSGFDTHEHLGSGQINFKKIKTFLQDNAIITLETDKDSKKNLDDFIQDCLFMRKIQNEF